LGEGLAMDVGESLSSPISRDAAESIAQIAEEQRR
jgi:hypothetical protein